jgi:hypothetical protein
VGFLQAVLLLSVLDSPMLLLIHVDAALESDMVAARMVPVLGCVVGHSHAHPEVKTRCAYYNTACPAVSPTRTLNRA